MVGKWYKFIGKSDSGFTTDKWYKCRSNLHGVSAFTDKNGHPNGFYPKNPANFDLSNPMDYNPYEVKEENTIEYFYIGGYLNEPSDPNFTKHKKYSIRKILDTYSVKNDLGEVVLLTNINHFIEDLNHLLKGEKKEEPNFRVETITIVIFNDGKYQTNTTLSLKELVKHLKEATYRLDKQINEET